MYCSLLIFCGDFVEKKFFVDVKLCKHELEKMHIAERKAFINFYFIAFYYSSQKKV